MIPLLIVLLMLAVCAQAPRWLLLLLAALLAVALLAPIR